MLQITKVRVDVGLGYVPQTKLRVRNPEHAIRSRDDDGCDSGDNGFWESRMLWL